MAKANSPESQEKQKQLTEQTQSRQLWAISKFLGEIKFRKRLFGVDEADVWRKIERLCELYEDALTAERAKSDQLDQKLKAIRARAMAMKAEKKPAPKQEVKPDGEAN